MTTEARSTIWSVQVTFEAFTEEEAVAARQQLKELVAAEGSFPSCVISELALVMPLVTDDDLTPPDLSESLE